MNWLFESAFINVSCIVIVAINTISSLRNLTVTLPILIFALADRLLQQKVGIIRI
jgi:hypothetical protein